MSWWGVGIANAVNSGMRTYSNLRGIQDDDEKRQEREEAKKIMGETYGKVGTMQPDGSWSNQTMPEGPGEGTGQEFNSPKAPVQNYATYSESQAAKDASNRLRAAGQHDRALQHRQAGLAIESGDLQLKGLKRADVKGEADEKERKLYEEIFAWKRKVLADPSKAEEFFVNAYENPEKGGPFDDGHGVRIMDTPQGKVAQFYDKKSGAPVGQPQPVNRNSMYQLVTAEANRRAAAVGEKGDERYQQWEANQFQRRRSLRQDERADRHLGIAEEGNTRAQRTSDQQAALHPGQLAQQRATLTNTQQSTANRAVAGQIASYELSGIKANVPLAEKFGALSEEAQQGPEGQALLKKMLFNRIKMDPTKLMSKGKREYTPQQTARHKQYEEALKNIPFDDNFMAAVAELDTRAWMADPELFPEPPQIRRAREQAAGEESAATGPPNPAQQPGLPQRQPAHGRSPADEERQRQRWEETKRRFSSPLPPGSIVSP